MNNDDNIIRVFSGSELLVLMLKSELEEVLNGILAPVERLNKMVDRRLGQP